MQLAPNNNRIRWCYIYMLLSVAEPSVSIIFALVLANSLYPQHSTFYTLDSIISDAGGWLLISLLQVGAVACIAAIFESVHKSLRISLPLTLLSLFLLFSSVLHARYAFLMYVGISNSTDVIAFVLLPIYAMLISLSAGMIARIVKYTFSIK